MITNTTGILILVLVAAAIAFAWYMNKRREAKRDGDGKRKPGTTLPDSIAFSGNTPKGVVIQAYKLIPPDAFDRMAEVVDMGVSNLLRATKATRPAWTQKLAHSDYIVLFKKPDATNQDGSPAILVHGIQSAGTVIGVANDGFAPAMIVLPFQDEWNHLSYLMYSVWHESEHDIEFASEPNGEFLRYLGANDAHPHRPMPEGLEIEMPPQAFGFKGIETRIQPKCGFHVNN